MELADKAKGSSWRALSYPHLRPEPGDAYFCLCMYEWLLLGHLIGFAFLIAGFAIYSLASIAYLCQTRLLMCAHTSRE
ncbi:MAG: hypothetical protein ACR2MC_07425 [Actinomycetota bacterium]